MADFWIKVEKSTPDKPEIFEIAQTLDIDPDAVLGKLIRVWSWLDSNSENGHIKSVTDVLIDRLTTCPGFAKAMKEAGWMDDGQIPNFDRHLGKSAKKRAKDSERKRKSRETSNECPTESVTESGLDKSRVDKSNNISAGDKSPSCPHNEIIDLYHERLPELPAVQKSLWPGSQREKLLRSRWKQSEKHQTLDFWSNLFNHVSKSDFLMGRNSAGFKGCTLEWIVKPSNFVKIIEGNYHE